MRRGEVSVVSDAHLCLEQSKSFALTPLVLLRSFCFKEFLLFVLSPPLLQRPGPGLDA